jgi:hypothetical protein
LYFPSEEELSCDSAKELQDSVKSNFELKEKEDAIPTQGGLAEASHSEAEEVFKEEKENLTTTEKLSGSQWQPSPEMVHYFVAFYD